LEVALLFILRCKLVQSTIISLLIIQQSTNTSTVITELPLSDPGGPCEGGTRPGSDATSSPVALRCREKVSWLHSNTAARERRLTKVLSAHWRSDGSTVVVTFDEVHGDFASSYDYCAWLQHTCHNDVGHLRQSVEIYMTSIIDGQSAMHATNYLLPSASQRTPARTAH
jgi:hypothetical protein